MSELSGKMPTKHQELKRCPFCGEAGQLTSGGDCWIAHCSQVAKEFEAEICCHFVPESGYVSTIEEAIAAWNHRPDEDALVEALVATRQLNLQTCAVGTIGNMVFDKIRAALQKAGRA
jgi:hypothetical protein